MASYNQRYDPFAGERMGRAWRAALDILGDGGWYEKGQLVPLMSSAGPIQENSAGQLLNQGYKSGALERSGEGEYRLSPHAPRKWLRPSTRHRPSWYNAVREQP